MEKTTNNETVVKITTPERFECLKRLSQTPVVLCTNIQINTVNKNQRRMSSRVRYECVDEDATITVLIKKDVDIHEARAVLMYMAKTFAKVEKDLIVDSDWLTRLLRIVNIVFNVPLLVVSWLKFTLGRK